MAALSPAHWRTWVLTVLWVGSPCSRAEKVGPGSLCKHCSGQLLHSHRWSRDPGSHWDLDHLWSRKGLTTPKNTGGAFTIVPSPIPPLQDRCFSAGSLWERQLGSNIARVRPSWDGKVVMLPPSPVQKRHFNPASLITQVYTPSFPLVRVGQAWKDELFWFSWGSPSQYTVSLLLDMVPWDYLNSWRGDICFDSMAGNPKRPFNLRIHLKLFLCLCCDELRPQEEFVITIAIDTPLSP